jgi:NAD(P) transhydrogenase subunit beta
MQMRHVLLLGLATLLLVFAGVAGYHRDIAAGHFIARAQMAALGLEVALGALATSGALVALAKRRWWISPGPRTYRGQAFVNAPFAAFIFGMLVYLVVYPPTPWVFYTMTGLTLAFGVLLMLPLGGAEAPTAVALLCALTGLAASAAGFAARDGLVVMAGAVVAASGFALGIAARSPAQLSPLAALGRAFTEPAPPRDGPPAPWY